MIKLYDHQQTALDLLRLNDGFALFMEQGTGKTFPVLFRLCELVKEKKVFSIAIVAPKAVMGAWSEKIKQLDTEQQKLLNNTRLEIVSYDSIWRKKYANEFFDAIVLDEAHYIKNHSAKRTKGCLKKCRYAKYRYILTGTPTSNGQLCNLYSLMAAVTPTRNTKYVYPCLFGGVPYTQWLKTYAYLNQYFQPYRYHNVDDMQEKVKSVSWRVTKDECLDLPEKLPNEIWQIDLDPKAKKMHTNIFKHSADVDANILADNPLTRLLRLRQISSGFVVNDDGETLELNNNKLNTLTDYLKEVESKTVVFCEFRHSIDAISRRLDELKIKHIVIDGRTQDKEIFKKFQDDAEVRVCVCQYASGSAGIDLYASSVCVFYEPTLSSNLHEQARDRIHRIGQNRHCEYIYLLSTPSIERSIYNALINYQDFNEKLFTECIKQYTKGDKL